MSLKESEEPSLTNGVGSTTGEAIGAIVMPLIVVIIRLGSVTVDGIVIPFNDIFIKFGSSVSHDVSTVLGDWASHPIVRSFGLKIKNKIKTPLQFPKNSLLFRFFLGNLNAN